ncbi:hypothetical protein FIU87_06935 [Bacillus sp. THAF10]|uniref:DUF3899 domain-containing protein n=1 Tax=Bacillus sp. THAF10 TaxID=2587848 RepID=UPI00126904F9|nr:DUF3899 domain-containing protein [Bacillus sp. THAF10]QFT88373.1 hypothetical protein FIU87_06935 [Bacillus sp. THAF10]
MNKLFVSSFLSFVILFLISLLTGYLYYGSMSVLSFINTSFIYASIFIFVSLLLLVTQKGFFDGITYGFRRIFASSQYDKELEEDVNKNMRPPSVLTQSLSIKPLLLGSIILFGAMLISLYFYYSN